MKPKEKIDDDQQIEAVVGIFEDPAAASRVAASMRGAEIELQRVSRRNPSATDEMPDIVYDSIEEVSTANVTNGVLQGGAIGVGSGLLLIGIPVLNVLAPIAGGLAGAFIGGTAGVDEANRGIKLPNQEDYQRMLAEGRSIVVIAGTEAQRIVHENEMRELGAIETHQHPPIRQAIRDVSE